MFSFNESWTKFSKGQIFKKCEFVVTSIIYLRHKILPNGIMVHWAKVVAILEMPNPIDVHTLRSFIRLCNYSKIYVQDFSLLLILSMHR
jgi:hypothetical protein